MRIAILTFSERGERLGGRIAEMLARAGAGATSGSDAAPGNEAASTLGGEITVDRCAKGGLAAWADAHFGSCDALVFVGAAGIAVRTIAPHVAHKTSDPAVVVVDERGTFAISLLSGHIGGANALASAIAASIGAVPVITTATDVNGVFAVDTWAKGAGLVIVDPERIVDVSGALIDGRTVALASVLPVAGELPHGVVTAGPDVEADPAGATDAWPAIDITYRRDAVVPRSLQLVPRVLAMGLGCRRDTPEERIDEAVRLALDTADVRPEAICRVASIDVKAHEPGLLAWCAHHELPFLTYTASELAAVAGDFTPSAFVAKTVGVDNVCERSAVKASGDAGGTSGSQDAGDASSGRLVLRKFAHNGVTVALAEAARTIRFDQVNQGQRAPGV